MCPECVLKVWNVSKVGALRTSHCGRRTGPACNLPESLCRPANVFRASCGSQAARSRRYLDRWPRLMARWGVNHAGGSAVISKRVPWDERTRPSASAATPPGRLLTGHGPHHDLYLARDSSAPHASRSHSTGGVSPRWCCASSGRRMRSAGASFSWMPTGRVEQGPPDRALRG